MQQARLYENCADDNKAIQSKMKVEKRDRHCQLNLGRRWFKIDQKYSATSSVRLLLSKGFYRGMEVPVRWQDPWATRDERNESLLQGNIVQHEEWKDA